MGLINKLGKGLRGKIGIGILAIGLAGSLDYSSNSIQSGLLESRVNAAEQSKDSKPEKDKESYTFDEVTKALGERYSQLSEEDKKKVKGNYEKGKSHIQSTYKTLTPRVYNKKEREKMFDNSRPEDLIELYNFKFKHLKEQDLKEYLEAFPWMKNLDFKKIDKEDFENPDKLMVYSCELYKHYEKEFSGMFDGLRALAYFQSICRGVDYLSKIKVGPKVKKSFGIVASFYSRGYLGVINEGLKEATSWYKAEKIKKIEGDKDKK